MTSDSSLAYSNIMAEWLTTGKQNRVYIPEEPFPHGMLAKSGRLKSFRNLSDEAFSSGRDTLQTHLIVMISERETLDDQV